MFPLRIGLFLILSFVITALTGFTYIVVQQNYRQNANDPQVQISEYAANLLNSGGDINSILPPDKADLSKSLSTFIIVYNDKGEAQVSSAQLNGETPQVPAELLQNADIKGQHRVTWQPQDGVRLASIISKYNGGYVLVGRSLREIEARKKMLGIETLMFWIIVELGTLTAAWFLIPKQKSH